MVHMLSVDKLTKCFQQGESTITVLHEISASFTQGNSCAIIGVSGSGKSTLLHLLAGLDQPSQGSVLYDNIDITHLCPKDRNNFLNKTIGLVFQSPYLIRELSVLENIMLPGLIAQHSYNECKEQAQILLDQIGLTEKKSSKPASLSGGQQQRVALARALYNKPTFLLADEPTGNLDIQTGTAIIDLIIQLQKQWNMGVIISTHDDYVAERMQRVDVLRNGQLIHEKK